MTRYIGALILVVALVQLGLCRPDYQPVDAAASSSLNDGVEEQLEKEEDEEKNSEVMEQDINDNQQSADNSEPLQAEYQRSVRRISRRRYVRRRYVRRRYVRRRFPVRRYVRRRFRRRFRRRYYRRRRFG